MCQIVDKRVKGVIRYQISKRYKKIAEDERKRSTEGVNLSGDPQGLGTVIGWHFGESRKKRVPKGQGGNSANLSGKRTENCFLWLYHII